ncbi:PLP-dependent aminotransferase family protein [Corynebacterium sputi]|uniref:aminotransferase-like domain-containing protein n=1 Tax=Corynebacterium sputi TaxID=489915 RepID=UPI00041A0CEA|nr:PLP-dependent aminotransferase family protein [Corynebacterium sputi]
MFHSSSSRIATALRTRIAEAPAGTKLPSSRSLVAEFQASPVTVQQALSALTTEGLIESRPGVGTFTRAIRTVTPSDFSWQTAALGTLENPIPTLSPTLRMPTNDVVNLHSGYPEKSLLPERLVRSALARAARSDYSMTQSPAAGLPELRAWFAADLASSTPSGLVPPVADDVIVLPGSQSGLSTLFRTLVGAGQPLLIESPSYWGAILAAAQVGVQLVPVASGPDGPDPDDIDRAFTRTGARAFYAQPNFANPSGTQWSTDLGEKVLTIVKRHGAFLIEDDWAHDFGISSDPQPIAAQDDTGHVVYLRSLTKSMSPAVRVAGLVARGPAHARILADTQAQAMYVSGVLQGAAVDVVKQSSWSTHLRALRDDLRIRRDLLVSSLSTHASEAHLETVPRGGLNLWVRLPSTADLHTVTRDCESNGVIAAAGDDWFPAESTGKYLRLNYAATNPGGFDRAARVIGQSITP